MSQPETKAITPPPLPLRGGRGVAVGCGVLVGGGMVSVGEGVSVGGTGVLVGGTGVGVAGRGVAVGGSAVSAGGTVVAVGGTDVAVGLCWPAITVGVDVAFSLHAVVPKSIVSKTNRVRALSFIVFFLF